MQISHTRDVHIVDNQVKFDSKLIDLVPEKLGTVPDIQPNWAISCLISLGSVCRCLKLKHDSGLIAFWFLDKTYGFLTNSTQEFIKTSLLQWPQAESIYSTGPTEEFVEDMYTFIEEICAASKDVHPLNVSVVSLPGTHPAANDFISALHCINTQCAVKFSIFNEIISRSLIETSKLKVDLPSRKNTYFDIFMPLKNFWYVAFSSESDVNACLLITNHNKIAVAIYDFEANQVFSRIELGAAGLQQSDLQRIKLWSLCFHPYLKNNSKQAERIGIVFRENHLGHYIWNELSAVEAVLRQGKKVSVFTYPECDEPVFPVDSVYPELIGHVERGVTSSLSHLKAAMANKVSFVPFAELYVTESLAERVSNIAMNLEPELTTLLRNTSKNSNIILIGLRLENRCWIRQKEGYISLLRRLGEIKDRNFTLIFDGHNFSGAGKGQFIQSYQEWNLRSDGQYPKIVQQETDIAEAVIQVKSAEKIDNVRVINLIPCTIASSIVAAKSADLFVTHWGAGLAKYKWIANARGCIISSASVLSGKGDLHIYDSKEFRENAIGCAYIDHNHVSDYKPNEQRPTIDWEGSGRENFDLDPEYFTDFVLESIK